MLCATVQTARSAFMTSCNDAMKCDFIHDEEMNCPLGMSMKLQAGTTTTT